MTNEEYVTALFEFLDNLRESGSVNMFGASPYIADEFGLTKQEARAKLSLWMKYYSESPMKERVDKALKGE